MRGSADYFVSGGITQTVYILLTVVCVCVYSAHCRFWRDWPYGPGPGSADGKKMVWGLGYTLVHVLITCAYPVRTNIALAHRYPIQYPIFFILASFHRSPLFNHNTLGNSLLLLIPLIAWSTTCWSFNFPKLWEKIPLIVGSPKLHYRHSVRCKKQEGLEVLECSRPVYPMIRIIQKMEILCFKIFSPH